MAFYKRGRHSGRKSSGVQRARGSKRKKDVIHISKLIKTAKPVVEEVYKPKHTFGDFDISQLLKKNLAKKGFKSPSPIQDQSIPEGLKGKDVIGIANTGTGKTIAFAIPVIQKLLENKMSHAIIMAPTRELAEQIRDEISTLTHGTDLRQALLIGGMPMFKQVKELKNHPRIVIGTPGRIQDHLKQKNLDLSHYDVVVLDEVDRMLDMGFVNDMRKILSKTAQKRQSLYFSATMNESVRRLINDFTHKPVTISVVTGETSNNVNQDVVKYGSDEEKIERLHDVLNCNRKNKVLIFDATKRGVDRLGKKLHQRGFTVDTTHGNKSQNQRKKALLRFKSNQIRILIATDVAARGIDVADITHVINYSMPQSYEDYVHRIGRAGRAGRVGYALTFIAS